MPTNPGIRKIALAIALIVAFFIAFGLRVSYLTERKTVYSESCVDHVVYLEFSRGDISPKYTPDGKIAVCSSQGQTEKPVP